MSKKEDGSWKQMAKTKEAEPIQTTVTFKKLSALEVTKYLKTAVHGLPKSGKTRFSLTWPAPLYVILTEPGLRPLIKLFPDKEIYYISVYEPDYGGLFEVEATKTLARIDSAVRLIRDRVQKDPKSVGTVVVDSVTDIWKWVQEWMKSEVLKIDKTARVRNQWDWGHASNKYQNIIMQLLSLPTHLVLTAQDKEEYAGPGAGTGIYVPRWMKQTPYWVDIIIGLVKIKDPQSGRIKYMSTIEDSRHMDENLVPIAGIERENLTYDEVIKILKESKK